MTPAGAGKYADNAAGLLSRGTTQYQFDPLGDAVLLLDGSGAVTANRLFDAWGNDLTAVAEPYGYRARYGYWADGETGLIALAFRHYAPGVGRFLNRDPIGYEGGVGLYGYVTNMPLAGTDPLGLEVPPVPLDNADLAVLVGPACAAAVSNLIHRVGAGASGLAKAVAKLLREKAAFSSGTRLSPAGYAACALVAATCDAIWRKEHSLVAKLLQVAMRDLDVYDEITRDRPWLYILIPELNPWSPL